MLEKEREDLIEVGPYRGRKGGIQGFRGGGMQEKMDAGKEGRRKGGCRKGGMQDRRDTGKEGCRKGGMQDRWDTA